MKKAVLLILVGFYGLEALAQESTLNDKFNQSWEVGSTWQDGTNPAYTNVGNAPTNVNFNIYGYTRLGSSATSRNLDFAGNHPTLTFTVYDTLVVFGNMTFGNDAMTLSVPAGGLLVVFGTLDVNNKVDISAGGNIVVTGQFKLTGAQADVTVSGSGAFYAGSYNSGAAGEVPDNVEHNAGADLQNNLPFIYNFINGAGVNPLPVELLSFGAAGRNNLVSLNWSTASELNFDYFEVERSGNPKDFTGIGKVRGHGTSSIRHDYSLTDEKPLVGKNYYRLKSVDFDGYTEYSKVVAVVFSADKEFSVFPNPSDGLSLDFSLNFTPSGNASIIVFDNMGNVIGLYKPSDYSQGISFPNYLKGGIYFAKLVSDDFVKVERFVVR